MWSTNQTAMRPVLQSTLLLLTTLAGAGCSTSIVTEGEEHGKVTYQVALPAVTTSDVLAFDAVQRTCALYTAVRSHAWNGPISFGQDLDDGMVHWNLCPGGEKVACVSVSDVMDGAVGEGIPWYPKDTRN